MRLREEDSVERLLADLNPPQREAVVHRGGPLMMLAGAGSGKTRVITYRIAHLLAEGNAQPWNILALAFTNKAAEEMRERIWTLLGRMEKDLWVSTFHAACARLLRGHAHLLGYQRDFAIYDDRDQLSLVDACLRDLNLDLQSLSPRVALSRIRAAKQTYCSPEEFLARGKDEGRDGRVGRVYRLYQERLRQAQAMDFDDLLYLTLYLFQSSPEILDYYRNRWRHVLVDEFQDTNHVQYRLVKALSEVHRNICVVGDDDQSIYSWRGADLGNILGFEKDFPDTRVIRLEQNYRSTGLILAASGSVIQRNYVRKDKNLWTENETGSPVAVYQAVNERDEAVFVADEILYLVSRNGYRHGDIAVFYRIHAQSRLVEEELLARQIPFSIYGGLGFYERKEIKDVVAYLRALIHPSDDVSWRRILNSPRRGIGRATVEAVEAIAAQEGISFSTALRRFVEKASRRGGPAARIRAFLVLMDRLAAEAERCGVGELVQRVLRETGYWEALERDTEQRAQERMENLRELLNLVGEAEAGADTTSPEGGLIGFLERVALISDVDRMDPQEDRVSLMTLHAAKGLEFPVVFILGLEEGLIPHTLSLDNPSEVEEERRLFYVGMTRAQRLIHLSCARRRRMWGTIHELEPSRFLGEIPPECLQACSPGITGLDAEQSNGPARPGLYVGRWVRHRALGVGTIQRIEGNGSRVVIHFPGEGEKRFLVEEAPLEWL